MKRGLLRSMPFWSLAALAALSTAEGPARHLQAKEITIEIKGEDGGTQYIEKDKSGQFPVVVRVGDTVKWANMTDDDHTATSDILKADGKRLFNVEVPPGTPTMPGVKEHKFTQDDYDAAAAVLKPGTDQRLHLGYFCDEHRDTMGAKIVLKPAEERTGAQTKIEEKHK